MKFAKLFSVLFVLAAGIYFVGCSSAEQTTAKLAFQQGDYQKAEVEFAKETQQNPQNEEAWFYLALSRAKLGKLEGVSTAIGEYRKIGKNTFRNELIDAWGMTYDEAYKDFQISSSITDENAQVSKLKESLNKFEIAYALIPDSVFVKQNIAAINTKINTITIKPMIDKGVELEKAGNYEAAIAEYNKALAKVSKGTAGYEVVTYNIAVANLKWGEKLREANSEDPAYKDKYTAALPYLEDLTSSKDKDNQITAYDLLVQVYANLGRTEDAQNAMKKRDELKGENK
jgi:tetratricopeptide (TPR) repeat protein